MVKQNHKEDEKKRNRQINLAEEGLYRKSLTLTVKLSY